MNIEELPVSRLRNLAMSMTLVGYLVAKWSMVYFFPDRSCTISSRQFTAESVFLGAGPYLLAAVRIVASSSRMVRLTKWGHAK